MSTGLRPARSGYLYAIWSGVSSLLVLGSLHRPVYRLLAGLSLPDLAVAALAGVANLSWYELAYVVGGALRSVAAFALVPLAGAAAGVLSAVAVFAGLRWSRHARRAHLAIGSVVAAFALLLLLRRWWLGFRDPWRSITTGAFLLTYCAWILAFRGEGGRGTASRDLGGGLGSDAGETSRG